MQAAGVDAYWVPSTDVHANEYVPACWQRRAWISGFTGSAGDVLVTLEAAYLWVDGRYTLAAEAAVDSDSWHIMGPHSVYPRVWDYLIDQAVPMRLGVDPELLSMQAAGRFESLLADAGGECVPLEANLVDALWVDQPPVPATPIIGLDISATGRSVADKMDAARDHLLAQSADYWVLTALDEIAWLFNLRANDIEHTPVAIAFAVISADAAHLFLAETALTPEAKALLPSTVTTHAYLEFWSYISGLAGRVLCEKSKLAWRVQLSSPVSVHWVESNFITQQKAIKNQVELAGIHSAHQHDGVAVVRFMAWLVAHAPSGVTEIEASDQLARYRLAHPSCRDLSFPTISAFGEHGAIVHYQASVASNVLIGDQALYLFDSGGQYVGGTTDITRTMHLGQPTAEEKRYYTLVLKGHLALSRAVFPAGTTGHQLDALARMFLWECGLDYAHGTGHGVGHYLSVHEGPQSISPVARDVALVPGMVLSNEPGYYEAGVGGIRIENLCCVVESEVAPGFYAFDTLTWVPYEKKLIDCALLTAQERAQIDAYHAAVRAQLGPALVGSDYDFLIHNTAPLVEAEP